MYFSLYPKVAYKIDDFDYVKAIDITSATKIKKYISDYRQIAYNPYIVKNGERPDRVSYKIYGSEKYDWLVLMINDVSNVYEEWPKSSEDLLEYTQLKYGTLEYATDNIKSYFDSLGNEIDLTTYNSLSESERSSESFYQYEVKENDRKSIIKILKPSFLVKIESDLRLILRETE